MAAERAALEELHAAEDSQNYHEQRPNERKVSRLNHFLFFRGGKGETLTPPHQGVPQSNKILDSADQISLLRSESSGVWTSGAWPSVPPNSNSCRVLLTYCSIPPH